MRLAVLVGLAAPQTARAEPAPSLKPAITHYATANSQMEQTLAAAISITAFAPRAPRGGNGRARSGFGDAYMGSDLRGDLVGGSFAWPYYNYCTRHPGDRNC